MKKSILSCFVAVLISLASYSQVNIDKPINLNGGTGERSITNLEAPVNATDAVNKAYVDAAAAGGCPAAGSGETLIKYNGCLYVHTTSDDATSNTLSQAKATCTALGSGWYLPTIYELNILYQNWNHPANGGTCQGGACPLSGFSNNSYWSSTLADTGSAWYVDFDAGGQSALGQNNSKNVRCVRR